MAWNKISRQEASSGTGAGRLLALGLKLWWAGAVSMLTLPVLDTGWDTHWGWPYFELLLAQVLLLQEPWTHDELTQLALQREWGPSVQADST